ncbi:UNVERIFIED_CONTAM: two-component system response regulator LytT [Brevibacillus sp. OAP136]
MLKVFIVDDEMPARAELRYLLQQYEDIEVIGEAASGEEALERIPDLAPDAVFLDIQLHDRDGVDVAIHLQSTQENPPVIVFATAYEMHAVRAFEAEAEDYLVKPINEVRLDKAIRRLRKTVGKTGEKSGEDAGLTIEQVTALVQSALEEHKPKRIPVEKNGKILLIDQQEIVYATVDGRYASIYTDCEQYATSFTLQELELKLPANQFYRTHRAFIVNLAKTGELIPWFKGSVHLIMKDKEKTEIPISRNAVKEVKRLLGF